MQADTCSCADACDACDACDAGAMKTAQRSCLHPRQIALDCSSALLPPRACYAR
ncbi:hypothetical protein XMIN_3816 [Xanthomonas citri pv. mangiferaeindicae LMG 941]|nr:hypothetical protein XMIN_3816 [Xanthomonas citri pv. mangiferaeindicae LMG 941]